MDEVDGVRGRLMVEDAISLAESINLEGQLIQVVSFDKKNYSLLFHFVQGFTLFSSFHFGLFYMI